MRQRVPFPLESKSSHGHTHHIHSEVLTQILGEAQGQNVVDGENPAALLAQLLDALPEQLPTATPDTPTSTEVELSLARASNVAKLVRVEQTLVRMVWDENLKAFGGGCGAFSPVQRELFIELVQFTPTLFSAAVSVAATVDSSPANLAAEKFVQLHTPRVQQIVRALAASVSLFRNSGSAGGAPGEDPPQDTRHEEDPCPLHRAYVHAVVALTGLVERNVEIGRLAEEVWFSLMQATEYFRRALQPFPVSTKDVDFHDLLLAGAGDSHHGIISFTYSPFRAANMNLRTDTDTTTEPLQRELSANLFAALGSSVDIYEVFAHIQLSFQRHPWTLSDSLCALHLCPKESPQADKHILLKFLERGVGMWEGSFNVY